MVLVATRHGQSEWNRENRFTGRTDIGLSAKGEEEAIRAGHMLKDCRFDAVFASGLVRSIRTADLIVGVQRFSGHVMRDRDLNERDYGSLTGRDKTEIVAEFGLEQVTAWRRSFSCPPPGGESLCEVAQRVGRCYEERIKPLVELGRNVLVVGHGNSLRALFVHLGLKDKKTVEAFEVETGMPMLIDVANGTYVHMDRET